MAAHVDCEAVLQEALLRVWQAAPRCRRDGRENSLLRLAARIARNLAIDELRRARWATAMEADALEAAMAAEAAAASEAARAGIRCCAGRSRSAGALPGRPATALAARIEAGGGDADVVLAAKCG